jgi:hypothetical protein
VGLEKVKLQLVDGSRSSLEDECWNFKPLELIKSTFQKKLMPNTNEEFSGNFSVEVLKELIRSNKIKKLVIDQRTAELHLSDQQFVKTFGMDKKEFSRLPKWRKLGLKREAELF